MIGRWRMPLLAVLSLLALIVIYARWESRPNRADPRNGNIPDKVTGESPSLPALPRARDEGATPAEGPKGGPGVQPPGPESPAIPPSWIPKIQEYVDGVFSVEDPLPRIKALERGLPDLLSSLQKGEMRLRQPIVDETYREFYRRETNDVNRAAILAKLGASRDASYVKDALELFAKGVATPAGQNAARYLHRVKYDGFRGEVLVPTIETLSGGASSLEKRLALMGLVEYQTDFPEAHDAIERTFLTDSTPGVPELALQLLSRQCSDATLCDLLGRTAMEGRTPSLRQAAVYQCLNAPGDFTDGRRALLERLSKEAPDGDVRDRAVQILAHVARFDKEGRQPDGLLPR